MFLSVVGNVRIHAYINDVKSGTGPTLSGLAEIPHVCVWYLCYASKAVGVKRIIEINIGHGLNDGKELLIICVCVCSHG